MYSKNSLQKLTSSLTKGMLAIGLVVLSFGSTIAQQSEQPTPEQLKNLEEIIAERKKANEEFKKWLTPERIKELGLVVVSGSDAPIDPKTGAMLVGLDIFGKPKFYKTTSNLAAGITTSANRVMVGGDLNLNLTGAGKIIHEWDGGRVRGTHQELT
ncbi:MAG: hypothetical protein ACOVMN_09320, partial [Flexibacteraceae bacterium]